MVCPDCYSGRTEKKASQPVKKEATKPAGWDMEDEYLDKVSRLKREETQAQFSQIPGTEHVKCRCTNCKYEFKYNPFTKLPRACPYCDVDVPRMKTFNLL